MKKIIIELLKFSLGFVFVVWAVFGAFYWILLTCQYFGWTIGKAEAQEFFLPREAGVKVENDVWAPTPTDHWLSSNIRLYYRDSNRWAFALGNEMYTPKDKSSTEIPFGDRPWDGYSYAEGKYRQGNAENARDYTLRVGAVGRASQTSKLQKFVHNDLGKGVPPHGWHTQNPSEVALDTEYRRSFLSFFESAIGGVEALKAYGLRVGTVNDSAFLEAELRRGFFFPQWELTARCGVRADAVAYNTFLDGRVFHDDVYTVDRTWFVAQGLLGISARFEKTKVSYVYKYLTEEFEDQPGRHIFGSVELTQEF